MVVFVFRVMRVVVFFFQAEDGIRDLVRSRGLGDVYKRQGPDGWTCENWNSMLGPPERFLAELASSPSTESYGHGWVTTEIAIPRFGGAIAVLLRESDLDILRACVAAFS